MPGDIAFPYEERNHLIVFKREASLAQAHGSFRPWRDGRTIETFTVPHNHTCVTESLLGGFNRILEQNGYDATASYHAALAVTEAVANALRQDGPVVWTQYLFEREGLDTLRLLLHTPESPAFDPRSLARYNPLDPANLLNDHRRGFLIMYLHASTLAYSTDGRETILEFHLPKTEKAINPVFSSYVA